MERWKSSCSTWNYWSNIDDNDDDGSTFSCYYSCCYRLSVSEILEWLIAVCVCLVVFVTLDGASDDYILYRVQQNYPSMNVVTKGMKVANALREGVWLKKICSWWYNSRFSWENWSINIFRGSDEVPRCGSSLLTFPREIFFAWTTRDFSWDLWFFILSSSSLCITIPFSLSDWLSPDSNFDILLLLSERLGGF